ncbi:MAG: DUF3103 domain-containing protein, partial [Psychrosphaera sp.]|nr:DUF3103 domain-containing protein [Psychrosphaera sp.]
LINQTNQSVSLHELSKSAGKLDLTEFNQFKREVIKAKGFPANTDGLVELRLADESMLSTFNQGVAPLFAFEPAGDESQWQYIEAFDSNGNSHLLEIDKMPTRPVFVIDINAKTDMKVGIAQMKAIFAAYRNGTAVSKQVVKAEAPTTSASTTLETSVLKTISLKDDHEPWISGSAEIYGVVTGIDASRADPILDVVEMPYLDHDGTTYYPNQIVIYWERYRWNAADMILMEHDDNTNYQELAIKLAETAAAIMAIIPDPTVQGLSVLGKLTAELIKAMPEDWFVNNDDYVDVFYTLLKNSTYTNYYGASANAKITLEPLVLSQ